ncbi:MAG: TatD family hydrolase [Bacteroidales bacterium]|nr:TatD family hydrolase [Bacteroidales bacterium]
MIDTHCHIAQLNFSKKLIPYLQKKKIYIIAVTNLPSIFNKLYRFQKSLSNVRLALGLHPLLYNKHEKEINLFESLINKTSYIGEIGLDFSVRDYSAKNKQIETLYIVLNLCKEMKKKYSIHSRKAELQVIEAIEKFKIENCIFHWYTGKLQLIERILSLGCYFSINPRMLNSDNGKKIISKIPIERILLESDAPYARNETLNNYEKGLNEINQYMVKHYGLSLNNVKHQLKNNFKSMFAG